MEEVLGELGQVRIDKRGRIKSKNKFGSFPTDVATSGQLRKRGDEPGDAARIAPPIPSWSLSLARRADGNRHFVR